jgi:BMFP domain-containing protein YqiC
MRLDTRMILIALVIFNVIAIGMSEVQRRALVENSLSSQTEFARQAADWSKQQADLLTKTPAHLHELAARINNVEVQQADLLARTTARLEELTARINKIEIQTAESRDADRKTQEIYDRVLDMQKTIAGWKHPGPTDERRR